MASDYLLEIDGIKGESQDDKHKETIEVESFSWGASHPGSSGLGTGASTGKVSFQDLHFVAHVNKASPKLMQACAGGDHIKKATLYVRKATGHDVGQKEFYTITLEDVLVSSYQSGGTAGSGLIPTDQFSLNFTKIKYEYKPQKADGSLDAPVTTGWDVKTNKKA